MRFVEFVRRVQARLCLRKGTNRVSPGQFNEVVAAAFAVELSCCVFINNLLLCLLSEADAELWFVCEASYPSMCVAGKAFERKGARRHVLSPVLLESMKRHTGMLAALLSRLYRVINSPVFSPPSLQKKRQRSWLYAPEKRKRVHIEAATGQGRP